MQEHKPVGPVKRWLGFVVAGLTAAGVSVAIYGGAQYLYQRYASGNSEQKVLDQPASAQPTSEELGLLRRTSEGFRAVAKKVGPAVVTIRATKEVKAPERPGLRRRGGEQEEEGANPFDQFDPFRDFFERFGQPYPMPETPQESLGSGFIVDKRGYVVTNHHVVKDTNKMVILPFAENSTEWKAKLVGTDPRSDLAVLKIEGKQEFPFIEWAESDNVEVGDWAIAMGSPFNLEHSMTVGIVSAKGRNSQAISGTQYGNLIQTDAAINPGNSGGPLCTIEGKVMGVNQAIYTRSGGYMGIGFAIPANVARNVVDMLIKDGKVIRGWLGVYIQPARPELLKELGVDVGIAVQKVVEGSPAAKAGIHAGDILLEVEGKKVTNVNELQMTISKFQPNQVVKVKLISYGEDKKPTKNIKVTIGKLPDEEPEEEAEAEEPQGKPDRLGLVVVPGEGGVKVKAVQPGSVGYGFLKPNDVILKVGGEKVTNVAQYQKVIKKGRHLNLFVKRDGQTLFFQFTLPE